MFITQVNVMRYFFIFYFILFFLGSNLKANAFTEIFGSEGAAGINNPKIRSLRTKRRRLLNLFKIILF